MNTLLNLEHLPQEDYLPARGIELTTTDFILGSFQGAIDEA